MKNNFLLFCVFLVIVSCANPLPRKPITRKSSSFMKTSVSFNKKLNAAEENEIKWLIERDSLNNYSNSSHGFWYTYNLKSKNNYFPEFGDKLVYTYEVFNLKNELIYSRDEIGERTYAVDQQELTEGLRNGLKMMNEGDVVTFLFPSHKVFGYLGDENKVGINQPLIYKVQLNKINKKNEGN